MIAYIGGNHDECGGILLAHQGVFSTLEGYHEGGIHWGIYHDYIGVSIQIQLFFQLPFPTLITISPRCTLDT